jgi:hypothetical protein
MNTYTVGMPMERIGIDILGPLPQSSRGNQYILVVADYFTKWTEAYAMRNQEADTVAEKLGLGIRKTRTTSHHPQSDGMVERYNRTLEEMLSKFVKDNQKDWDLFLPLLTMAYRATPQESTKFSPNKLMLGREVSLPVDIMIEGLPIEAGFCISEYVDQLVERMRKSFIVVREQSRRSAERQKYYYDTKAHGSPFKEGQFIWLFDPTKRKGLSSKLQRRWKGPFKIIQKISESLYKINMIKNGKTQIVHYDRLKIHKGEIGLLE